MRGVRIAVVITMYDETDVVNFNLSRLNYRAKDIYICRSTNKRKEPFGDLELPDSLKDDQHLIALPDLGNKTGRFELASRAITRNYSTLFTAISAREDVDWVLAITGDTKLWHLMGVMNMIGLMQDLDCVVGCSKAIGQHMHSADKTVEQLEAGKHGGRRVEEGMADMMPQLFIVKASEVRNGLFCNIPITNRWCSEQCLGDAYLAHGLPMERQHIMSRTAYGFTMGIRYNAHESDSI
jgi:hypothetical protein